jgi:hypothetical protein
MRTTTTEQDNLKRILEQTTQEHKEELRKWNQKVRDLEVTLAMVKCQLPENSKDKETIRHLLEELDTKDKVLEGWKRQMNIARRHQNEVYAFFKSKAGEQDYCGKLLATIILDFIEGNNKSEKKLQRLWDKIFPCPGS